MYIHVHVPRYAGFVRINQNFSAFYIFPLIVLNDLQVICCEHEMVNYTGEQRLSLTNKQKDVALNVIKIKSIATVDKLAFYEYRSNQ
jgi:hypothetical protein